MESRTRWRKSEPGVREAVAAVLEALRESLTAEALGLFDDDRADGTGPPGLDFWQAFTDLPCCALDFAPFYASLRRDSRAESTCACGRGHQVLGYLIHDRWVLLLIAPPRLDSGAVAALSSSLRALGEKLPPGCKPALDGQQVPYLERERAGGGGAPIWWVRNTRQ